MSTIKEPMYFCPDVRLGRRAHFQYMADEDRYLALFAGAADAKRAGEASTRYLGSRVAPNLIRDFSDDARIVVMLRNPVDMIHALHNERVSNMNEDVTDFAEALAADEDRRSGRRLPAGSNALGAVYRDQARYGELLERWFDSFGRDRVHVIVFEDFIADTPGVFRGTLAFLGLDTAYQPPSFAVFNKSHRQRRLLRRVADTRVGRIMTMRLLKAAVGEERRARLAKRFRRSSLSRERVARAPLTVELRRSLEDEFASDVGRLSALLDRDLSLLWFGRPASTQGAVT